MFVLALLKLNCPTSEA